MKQNTTQLMNELAKVLVYTQDLDALDDCRNICSNWLQSEEEKEAQLNLINAIEAVLENLPDPT